MQRPEPALLELFEDPARRTAALHEARRYGDAIFRLLDVVTPPERARFLVI